LVFDIGANVGERSAVLLSLGAQVVSVEPQSACVNKLKQRYGQRVTVVPMAVAAESGDRELILNTISDERATLSREHVEEGRFQRGWEGSVMVQSTTLDALINEHGMPQLCKIDVEALEPEVLRGLSEPVAVVVFEFHEGLPGTAECLKLLGALGSYQFSFRIGRSPRLAYADWVSGDTLYSRLSKAETPIYGDIVARLQPS
jgi:FkbM family methyltransferase